MLFLDQPRSLGRHQNDVRLYLQKETSARQQWWHGRSWITIGTRNYSIIKKNVISQKYFGDQSSWRKCKILIYLNKHKNRWNIGLADNLSNYSKKCNHHFKFWQTLVLIRRNLIVDYWNYITWKNQMKSLSDAFCNLFISQTSKIVQTITCTKLHFQYFCNLTLLYLIDMFISQCI